MEQLLPKPVRDKVLLGLCVGGLSLPLSLQAAVPFPTVDCVISPSKTVDISAPVPGVIEKIHAERSQVIRQGQLIAELDSAVEAAGIRLAQERADMSAELAAEQANLTFSQLQTARLARLRGDFLVSEQEQDEAKRSEEVTFWRIEQVKHAMEIRKLELARAQAQFEQKRVYSTIDGVVAERYKSEGEYVDDQPIMRLVKLDTLHVDAVFPMEFFPQIQVGMDAWVYPEIDQQQGYPTKIQAVDPLGDIASGTFGVRLVLDNPELQLPAGIKCFLKLEQTGEPLMTTAVSATKPGDPGLAEIQAGLETRITETPVDTSVLNKLTEQPWFPGHLLN